MFFQMFYIHTNVCVFASVIVRNMLKSPILTVDLSSYPFSSVNFLFVYFNIILYI